MSRKTEQPKKRRDSHVVIGPGGRFQCMHCGATHNPFPSDGSGIEIGAMVALSDWFDKEHRGCPKPPRPLCHFCLKPDHPSAEHVNLTTRVPEDWPGCGDTGLSSKVIWAHMTGRHVQGTDHPLDPSDFGRCYRLLAAPWAQARGWRARIGEMAAHGPVWARLASAWDELEQLYLAEAGGQTTELLLYKRMQALIEGARG